MLQDWLGEVPLAHFVAHRLGREPVARPSAAGAAVAYLGWSTLGRLLPQPDLDVLVVQNGREIEASPPRELGTLRRLLDTGLGLVIRRAERHDAGLAALAGTVARDLSGHVRVQLFVTAAETSGFGWHYDAEHVFIIQTHGAKDYYFRRNTIDPDPTPGDQPDFGRVREERTPIMTSTLVAGDWLHLPRGWWHVAKARTDSLSISLGVAL